MRPEVRKSLVVIIVVTIAASIWITYWAFLADVGGDRLTCLSNLRALSVQAFLYSACHGGRVPRSLDDVVAFGELDDKTRRCPAGREDEELRPGASEYVSVFGLPGTPAHMQGVTRLTETPMIGDARRFHTDDDGPYAHWVMMGGNVSQQRAPSDEVLAAFRRR
jgi:hypothetical protein